MKELLDTDRVNFLVWRFVVVPAAAIHYGTWLARPNIATNYLSRVPTFYSDRYLLESNYRETAAKLQKEWRVERPHRHFDFAPLVQNYALVETLNKGLIYDDFQRQFAAQEMAHAEPAAANVSADIHQRGVFGPLQFEAAVVDGEMEDVQEDESDSETEPEELDTVRKRPRHASLPNGSVAKRQKLSNGYENGADPAATPMIMDQHDQAEENNHAYPSPLEAEPLASPPPRTEGPERGTQVDKVQDLNQATTFLSLGTEEPLEMSLAPEGASNYQNPIVLHSEWNPRDPSILAAAGTDALARVFTLARVPTADAPLDHVQAFPQPSSENLLSDAPSEANTTAMAWNWAGTQIALAQERDNRGRISIVGPTGATLCHFQPHEPPIIKLRWCPNDDFVLAIGPDEGGALINVLSVRSVGRGSMSHMIFDHDLSADPLDATWISETEFVLCGGDLFISLRCTSEKIVHGRTFPTRSGESFNQVQFDWRSKLVATSSDKGMIDLWDESGQRRSIQAHLGVITSLQWQPLKEDPPNDERLLASSGEDGVICIWNARNSDNKPKYVLSMDQNPILAMSITPDGAFIAGATSEQILIWKMGDHAMPRASWKRPAQPGWLTPRPNGEMAEEEYAACLGWDAEGQKLVYGASSRLAVINFR